MSAVGPNAPLLTRLQAVEHAGRRVELCAIRVPGERRRYAVRRQDDGGEWKFLAHGSHYWPARDVFDRQANALREAPTEEAAVCQALDAMALEDAGHDLSRFSRLLPLTAADEEGAS